MIFSKNAPNEYLENLVLTYGHDIHISFEFEIIIKLVLQLIFSKDTFVHFANQEIFRLNGTLGE